MRKEHIIALTVICIATLEAIALIKGIDGQLFATTVGAISALVGYLFGKNGDRLQRKLFAKDGDTR